MNWRNLFLIQSDIISIYALANFMKETHLTKEITKNGLMINIFQNILYTSLPLLTQGMCVFLDMFRGVVSLHF